MRFLRLSFSSAPTRLLLKVRSKSSEVEWSGPASAATSKGHLTDDAVIVLAARRPLRRVPSARLPSLLRKPGSPVQSSLAEAAASVTSNDRHMAKYAIVFERI